jgi:glycine hydroxymethyltransferase
MLLAGGGRREIRLAGCGAASPLQSSARNFSAPCVRVEQTPMNLEKTDPEIFNLIKQEQQRQHDTLELIASENHVSSAVLEAAGSVLTNKYAEGYPGARYYQGCGFYDQVETLAIERAKQLFGAKHANVQPHSGANANLAAFMALMKPGDSFISMNLASGGHLSHGMKLNTSAVFYKPSHYELDPKTETIDFDSVRAKARELKPKVILCGYSAYPRTIDFAQFRAIADEVGAYMLADIAHIAGPGRGRRASVAVPARARRHHDDAQNPARPARRIDPDQRR